MEIERTTSTGTSTVGAVIIRYEISKDKNDNPVSLRANIYKELDIIGNANANTLREIGISFRENDLTAQQRKAVTDKILDDVEQTFSVENSESSQASE